MASFRLWLRYLSALAAAAIAALLCWQCIDIYLSGSGGDGLRAIFTAEDVAARLRSIAPLLGACVSVLLLTLLVHAGSPAEEPPRRRAQKGLPVSDNQADKAGKALPVGVVRLLLYGAAVVFILLGVMNGGLYDVLVKAVNICTECIGLG